MRATFQCPSKRTSHGRSFSNYALLHSSSALEQFQDIPEAFTRQSQPVRLCNEQRVVKPKVRRCDRCSSSFISMDAVLAAASSMPGVSNALVAAGGELIRKEVDMLFGGLRPTAVKATKSSKKRRISLRHSQGNGQAGWQLVSLSR